MAPPATAAPVRRHGGGVNSGALFALMSSLRTGNMVADMLICMLIPMLMGLSGRVVDQLAGVAAWLIRYLRRRPLLYRVVIQDGKGAAGPARRAHNHLLHQAVGMRLTALPYGDLVVRDAALSLESTGANRQRVAAARDGRDVEGMAERLERYHIVRMPREGEVVNVQPGVEPLLYFRARSQKTSPPLPRPGDLSAALVPSDDVTVTTYDLWSEGLTARERVDGFVAECMDHLKRTVREEEDKGRFFYTPCPNKGAAAAAPAPDVSRPSRHSSDKHAPDRLWKRYRLSENRTFESFFSPEKEEILRLVDNFTHKRDKFANPHFPQKLGLLLYGPPGTGKTSFIRCLAQHLGRSIVNIPLGRIETNQELMDMMFDEDISVAGQLMPTTLGFKRVVFVMEDVDAASDVVHTRKPPSEPRAHPDAGRRRRRPANEQRRYAVELTAESNSAGAAEFHTPTSAGLPPAGPSFAHPAQPAGRSSAPPAGEGSGLPRSSSSQGAAPDGDGAASGALAALIDDGRKDRERAQKEESQQKEKAAKQGDSLSLAGVLNVLDGVVDTPERIVVMTTNHPEKLDPALVRPGRINRRIHLTYMRAEEASRMVMFYFAGTPAAWPEQRRPELRAGLDAVFGAMARSPDKPGFTAAEIEEFCAEHDTVDDLLKHLRARAETGGDQ